MEDFQDLDEDFDINYNSVDGESATTTFVVPEQTNSSFDCGEQALGYVASRFLSDHPWLGYKTHSIPFWEQVNYPWITQLSRGGLVHPSTEFMAIVRDLDNLWKDHHGTTVHKTHVMRDMYAKAKQAFPAVPEKVLEAYVRTRTHIRLKALNHDLQVKEKSNRARNSKKLHPFCPSFFIKKTTSSTAPLDDI